MHVPFDPAIPLLGIYATNELTKIYQQSQSMCACAPTHTHTLTHTAVSCNTDDIRKKEKGMEGIGRD